MRQWLFKHLGIFQMKNEAELAILHRIEGLSTIDMSTKDEITNIVFEELKRIK